MEDKILVASPTYEGMSYCDEEFLDAIKDLDYPKFDILIVDNSGSVVYFNKLKKISGIKVIRDNTGEEKNIKRLISSRNKILKYSVDNNYAHLLMLDSDVIIPKNTLIKLLRQNKDIVTGLYFNFFNSNKMIKCLPVCWKIPTQQEFDSFKKKLTFPDSVKSRNDLKRHLTKQEIESGKLQEVFNPSAGCMLLSRNAFSQLKYGQINEEHPLQTPNDDLYFFNMAREKGFRIFCLPSIICRHLVMNKYSKDENGNLIYNGLLQ